MSDAEWSLAKARQDSVESVLRTEEIRTQRPRTSISQDGYRVDCYRGNLIDELYEEDGPRRRTVHITVQSEGTLISVGQLLEWNMGAGNSYDFWWVADAISKEESDVAYMIGSYWSYDVWPGDFGSIVLFNRLAIRSSMDRGHIALHMIRRMLEQEFGRRASLMLLKAFPLEYENQPDDKVDRRDGLLRRQRAMMRWYGQQLGVKPFVDQEAFAGWMWRPLRYCPEPTTAQPDESWFPE